MSSSSWFSSLRAFLTPPSRQSLKFSRQLLLGLVFGFALSLSSTSLALYVQSLRRKKAIEDAANAGGGVVKRPIEIRQDEIVKGVVGLIGNTPLIRINSLSDALGVEILGKAEYLNPGGSPKDRVALQIIEDAEASGLLHPHTGSCIFEGTVGSTGISIATIARAKGYDCEIVMPDDVAIEKVLVLEALGAKVVRVRPASIVDQTQFVNLARARALAFGETIITSLPSVKDELLHNASHHTHRHPASDLPLAATTGDLGRADENGRGEDDLVVSDQSPPGERGEGWKEGKGKRGFFANQFENPSNHFAHYTTTGPEIWRQTNGSLDIFVSGAGTGGTLSGVGRYLKEISGAFDRYDDGLDEQINDLTTTTSSSSAAAAAGARAKKKVEVELGRMDPLDGSVLGGFGGGGGGRREGGVKVVLSDPSGSGLYNKVKYGVMYDSKESEGKKRRHQVDTVVEGIGINRITHNFELGEDLIDEAYRVTDAEAVAMSRHLVLADGLFLGSSSACNLVACVRAVKDGLVPPGGKIVTILCDSGSRHYSKFWSDKYLEEHGIEVSSDISAILNE